MTWTKTPQDRQRDAQRYGPAWRRARKEALTRAGGRCQIRLEGCTGTATQVDHIDGAGSDPSHARLRAACAPCHRKVTAQQGGGWRAGQRKSDPSPQSRTNWRAP